MQKQKTNSDSNGALAKRQRCNVHDTVPSNQAPTPPPLIHVKKLLFDVRERVEEHYSVNEVLGDELQLLKDKGADIPDGVSIFKCGDGSYMRPCFLAENCQPMLDGVHEKDLPSLHMGRVTRLLLEKDVAYPHPRDPTAERITPLATLQTKAAAAITAYSSDPGRCNLVAVTTDPGNGKSIIPALSNLAMEENDSVVLQVCNFNNNYIVHQEIKKCNLDQSIHVLRLGDVHSANDLASYQDKKVLLQVDTNRAHTVTEWGKWVDWILNGGFLDRIRIIHFDDSSSESFMSGNSVAKYMSFVTKIVSCVAKRGRSSVVITDQHFSVQSILADRDCGIPADDGEGDECDTERLARYHKINRGLCTFFSGLGVTVRCGIYPIHLDYTRTKEPHVDIAPYIPSIKHVRVNVRSDVNSTMILQAYAMCIVLSKDMQILHCTADTLAVCDAIVKCQYMVPMFFQINITTSEDGDDGGEVHAVMLGHVTSRELSDAAGIPVSNVHTCRGFSQWFHKQPSTMYGRCKAAVKYIKDGRVRRWTYNQAHSMPNLLMSSHGMDGVKLSEDTEGFVRDHVALVANKLKYLGHDTGFNMIWCPASLAKTASAMMQLPEHEGVFGAVEDLTSKCKWPATKLADALDTFCTKTAKGTIIVAPSTRMVKSNNCFSQVRVSVDLLAMVDPSMHTQMVHRVRRPNNIHDTVYCIQISDTSYGMRKRTLKRARDMMRDRDDYYKDEPEDFKVAMHRYLRAIK